MSMSPRKIILRQVRLLEVDADLLATLRGYVKNENGTRLNEFGKAILRAAFESQNSENKVKAADIAKLLDITPGAVSQHYAKFRSEN